MDRLSLSGDKSRGIHDALDRNVHRRRERFNPRARAGRDASVRLAHPPVGGSVADRQHPDRERSGVRILGTIGSERTASKEQARGDVPGVLGRTTLAELLRRLPHPERGGLRRSHDAGAVVHHGAARALFITIEGAKAPMYVVFVNRDYANPVFVYQQGPHKNLLGAKFPFADREIVSVQAGAMLEVRQED